MTDPNIELAARQFRMAAAILRPSPPFFRRMKMAKVKAVRDFQHGHWGTRAKDEEFEYPVTEDPARLLADGFVERVASASAAGSKTEKEG